MSQQTKQIDLIDLTFNIFIISALVSILGSIMYVLITWFGRGSFLETKSIKIKSETSSSNKIGEGFRTYYLVTDINCLNPESLVTSQLQYKVNLKDGCCFNIIAEGTRSFYQTRWIKSAEEISCNR
jgi:hypothetical protein